MYSINGVLAKGSRHRGRSSVKGSNFVSKESVRTWLSCQSTGMTQEVFCKRKMGKAYKSLERVGALVFASVFVSIGSVTALLRRFGRHVSPSQRDVIVAE